jgi:chromodomain-helicase-DNA-binding protein 7
MITTPPASPTGEDIEIDSSKRRSARNTHRKKYVDDVMMRFSDDDTALVSPTGKRDAGSKSDEIKKEKTDEDSLNVSTSELLDLPDLDSKALAIPEDISGKPNYVYINTTDEDTMIVQFVLAQRMGKRELKPETPAVVKVEDPAVKDENAEIKNEAPISEEMAVKDENSEELKDSVAVDKEEKSEITDKSEVIDKFEETENPEVTKKSEVTEKSEVAEKSEEAEKSSEESTAIVPVIEDKEDKDEEKMEVEESVEKPTDTPSEVKNTEEDTPIAEPIVGETKEEMLVPEEDKMETEKKHII